MTDLMASIDAAREVSTPLLAITTPDQPAIVEVLRRHVNKKPLVMWDRARGYTPLNEAGSLAISAICQKLGIKDQNEVAPATAEPHDAMRAAYHFPKETIFVAMSMNRFLNDHGAGHVVQAVLNLRDVFKSNQRTLIMLSPDFSWPAELRHDVIILDDPLPDAQGYADIIQGLYEGAELVKKNKIGGGYAKVEPSLVEKATLAVRGLSAFEAEQVLAMSLALSPKQDGIDLAQAWELKKRAVSKVKGLTMTLDGPPLSDLRGLDQIIKRLNELWDGPEPPLLVVRVDEIDKGLAGLGERGGPGDNTGITQDLHQQFLTNMEDNKWIGAMLVGVRGAGKTVLTQAIGAAHGIPTIAMDTGQMKGGIVGTSEASFRDAFRTIYSIGGSRVLVLATCNKLDAISPELMRRFTYGKWYFDILSDEERKSLWPVYLKKYGHPLDSELPNDEGYTGAEIRNACDIAYRTRRTVKEIGETMIVPVVKSDPKSVENARDMADGKLLSVTYPGTYHRSVAPPVEQAPTGRFMKTRES